MAPKRKAEINEVATSVAKAVAARRVTRSMSLNVGKPSLAPAKNGKEKPGQKTLTKTVKKTEASVASTEAVDKVENSADVEVKKTAVGSGVDVVTKKSKSLKVDAAGVSRTIVIEYCKQCNAFKTRALLVKEGLEKGVLNVTVLLNPDKPRRGCFEIREKDGEKFISLLEMKRPFKPMKDLDMEEVIADVVTKISAA